VIAKLQKKWFKQTIIKVF